MCWDPCFRKGLFGECLGGMKPCAQQQAPKYTSTQVQAQPSASAESAPPVAPLVSDYTTRKGNLSALLLTIESMALTYQSLLTSSGPAASDIADLNQQIQALNNKLNDLDHATETYEKEFLDRKELLQVKNGGFQTLQDIVLVLFFVGLFVLSILLILSAGSFNASFSMAIVLFVMAVLSMQLIRFYG